MTESKAWNWADAEKERWLVPSEECVYLAEKWKGEGAETLLDLGCGLGRHTLYFAEKGFSVSALDLSPEAVIATAALLTAHGFRPDCRKGDMVCLPYPENSFDRIFSYRVISHQDTKGVAQVIREIARVLKPGGRIFVTLCSKAHAAWQDPNFPRVDENTLLKTEGAEVNVPHFFADKALLRTLFRDFRLLSVRHVTDCDMDRDGGEKCHYHIEAAVEK